MLDVDPGLVFDSFCLSNKVQNCLRMGLKSVCKSLKPAGFYLLATADKTSKYLINYLKLVG